MTRHHQLKNEARRAEQRSDWERAIELYKAAIRYDEESGSSTDVGVYNRVGDLYLRLGDTAAAVESYEQAADRYAASGMHTSAIALCNKVLRIAPDRHEIHGRLARLHASTGLLAEARSALMRFCDRMREADRLGEAMEAVQDLVSLTGDEELRTGFAEQLEAAGLEAQAVAQLQLVYRARQTGGRDAMEIRNRILALDPEADPEAESPPPPRATPMPPVGRPEVDEDLAAEEVVEAGAGPEPDAGMETEPAADAEAVAERDSPPVKDPEPALGATEGPRERAVPNSTPAVADGVEPAFESVLSEFREQVETIVDPDEHEAHYDLGVAYMGMDLLDEAADEFGKAMDAPSLAEAARALLEECRPAPVSPGPNGGNGVAQAGPSLLPLADSETPSEPGVPGDAAGDGDPANDRAEEADRPDEDELATILFQARLAQHRARSASEAGRTDHAAHFELAQTYERMGLLTEAVAELTTALAGPEGVQSKSLDALERIVAVEAIEAELLRTVMPLLIDAGRAEAALDAGRAFLGRPALREADRQAISALLPAREAEEPEVVESVEGPGLAGSAGTLPETGSGAAADRAAIPSDEAEALFGEAEGLRAAGRMDEAASHYYRALELFERRRDAIQAIRAVDRLLGLRPDDVVLHHQKTEFAIMTNDRELLISAYLDLASCLRRQNGRRSARTVYARILDLDPENAEARAGIAAVEADELARERRRQSRPESGGPRAASPALVTGSPGEIDQMFDEIREADEEEHLSPPDFESHFELGVAFRQMEMWAEAAREFGLAAEGMTDPLPAWEGLGECLVKLHRYDEARRTLSVATEQPGGDEARAGVLFHLGVAHLRAGDPAAARECLQRVLRVDPDRSEAEHLLSTLPA